MEITCLALYAFLKEKLQIEEPDPKLADKEIHQILLYTGGSCREHVLYLVTGEDFPEEGMMIQIGRRKIFCCQLYFGTVSKLSQMERTMCTAGGKRS